MNYGYGMNPPTLHVILAVWLKLIGLYDIINSEFGNVRVFAIVSLSISNITLCSSTISHRRHFFVQDLHFCCAVVDYSFISFRMQRLFDAIIDLLVS